MSFDLHGLEQAIARHGRVARVVVAATRGSAPREVGAAMLVWPGGQSGTIGGGALEHGAAQTALDMRDRLDRLPLGPALGQCCGGSVTLLTEVWDPARLARIGADGDGGVVARPLPTPFAGQAPEMPLAVARIVAAARNGSARAEPGIVQGWMVEPLSTATRQVWVWGAGHVGRAIVAVLAPLPDLAITWVDTAADRFPETPPDGVSPLIAADPAQAVKFAPADAEHLILTYSHSIDLELCHALLSHDFAFAGLIGSNTKWARFRARLAELGHSPAQISRICCPIGQKNLGKHPQAIAVGVASTLLSNRGRRMPAERAAGGTHDG